MNQVTEAYVTAHQNLAQNLAGQSVAWVRQMREQGLSRLQTAGFPTTRDEAWKYTNVRPITKHRFTPATPQRDGLSLDDTRRFALPGLNSHRLVFVNGHFSQALCDLSGLPEGLFVGSLASALERDAAAVEPYLGRCAPENSHGFDALNSAFLTDGAYIRIDSDCVLERPVEILCVSSSDGEDLMNLPRNLIIAGAGSQSIIIERYVAAGGARYLTNSMTELFCAADSTVEHYKLQQEDINAFHVGGLYLRQERSSRFTSHNIAIGGSLVRNALYADLADEGVECNLNGLYLGTGRQHLDNYTHIDHSKPNCTSREFYKGILDGRARAVFHGRIVVHADAQHTDAQQENKNLLLSRDAEVDTKPQLEIYADDVKCAHGATVGQLDADAMFYLRSRGVEENAARSILTYAFANDVLERVSVAPIRVELEKKLTSRLLDGRHLENPS
ncbi:MAG: Fe-S cluster assembly protein SufD [Gammaproteobacteria bacterium]|nr:Fe-S cluster assembly protein SufD [Gammaproteobacteria bacterium]